MIEEEEHDADVVEVGVKCSGQVRTITGSCPILAAVSHNSSCPLLAAVCHSQGRDTE